MTAPQLLKAPAADTLASLEFDIVCDWGTNVYPRANTCTTPADWLALGHDCTTPGNLSEYLLCDAHLAQLRTDLDGRHTYCRACGHRASTFNEWIYRVIGAR